MNRHERRKAAVEHALMANEARKVADVMEETMHKYPNDPEGATLPNIIMALRVGCDKAEREAHP